VRTIYWPSNQRPITSRPVLGLPRIAMLASAMDNPASQIAAMLTQGRRVRLCLKSVSR